MYLPLSIHRLPNMLCENQSKHGCFTEVLIHDRSSK